MIMENVLAMLADEAMLLHVKDVARILTVSTSCAYALIRSGQIKCIRIGRTYRIPKTFSQTSSAPTPEINLSLGAIAQAF